MPSFWKRGSNTAAGPAIRTSQASAMVSPAQPVLGGGAERAEIGAGAECLARTGDDHGMHVRIVLRVLDREAQSGGNFLGDRVAPVGVVNGDKGDTTVDLKQHTIHPNPPLSGLFNVTDRSC